MRIKPARNEISRSATRAIFTTNQMAAMTTRIPRSSSRPNMLGIDQEGSTVRGAHMLPTCCREPDSRAFASKDGAGSPVGTGVHNSKRPAFDDRLRSTEGQHGHGRWGDEKSDRFGFTPIQPAAERRNLLSPRRQPWDDDRKWGEPRSGDTNNISESEMSPLRGFPFNPISPQRSRVGLRSCAAPRQHWSWMWEKVATEGRMKGGRSYHSSGSGSPVYGLWFLLCSTRARISV